jgi:hypothetical protein
LSGTVPIELETVDLTRVPAEAALWEKVIRKLRTGSMPPTGRPRPDTAAADSFASWLENEIDRVAAANPNPGRTEPLHRLNRTEYQNAIRDLLALDIDAAKLVPADDQSYGFDNIAGVLKVSPTLLERYMSAAREVSRLAVGASPMTPAASRNTSTVMGYRSVRAVARPFRTTSRGMATTTSSWSSSTCLPVLRFGNHTSSS